MSQQKKSDDYIRDLIAAKQKVAPVSPFEKVLGVARVKPPPSRPVLVGSGPSTFSTSVEIQRFPPVIWDTNRYYRDLGVEVRATRKELAQAYVEKDGQNSRRLTYVFKQLLDEDKRRKYDAVPLGSIFYDLYVAEMHAALDAIYASEVGASEEDQEAGATSVEEKLKEYEGQYVEDFGVQDQDEEELDSALSDLDNDGNLSHPSDTVWPYTHYEWGRVTGDEQRMQEWQRQLCLVLGSRKEVYEIAVGEHGLEDDPVFVSAVGYRIVVFLRRDQQPSELLARQAAIILKSVDNAPSGH
jgi:hypothetical protein